MQDKKSGAVPQGGAGSFAAEEVIDGGGGGMEAGRTGGGVDGQGGLGGIPGDGRTIAESAPNEGRPA